MTVPEQDAAYLRAHYKTQTVPEMAKELKRASTTVYGFMEALGLEPKGRQIKKDHPFKRQNRKLETLFLGRRIENGVRKRSQQ
jgi:hypothetical protein